MESQTLAVAIDRWLTWNACVGEVNGYDEVIVIDAPPDWFMEQAGGAQ